MLPLDELRTRDGRRLHGEILGDAAPHVIVPNGAVLAGDLAALWQRRGALVYDLRNRGASDAEPDAGVRARGLAQDVEDLVDVCAQRRLARVDVVAHSYVGAIAVAFAVANPERVRRLVLIGTPGYGLGRGAPPPPDAVARTVFEAIGALMKTPSGGDPVARCEAFWQRLAPLYVVAPSLATRVRAWGRCHLANERAFMATWQADVEPSLRALAFTPADLARVTCPVLVVQGAADRSVAPADGDAWAAALPNARLLRVDGAAHAPWLDAPAIVLPALETFLSGSWPDAATRVAASRPAEP